MQNPLRNPPTTWGSLRHRRRSFGHQCRRKHMGERFTYGSTTQPLTLKSGIPSIMSVVRTDTHVSLPAIIAIASAIILLTLILIRIYNA